MLGIAERRETSRVLTSRHGTRNATDSAACGPGAAGDEGLPGARHEMQTAAGPRPATPRCVCGKHVDTVADGTGKRPGGGAARREVSERACDLSSTVHHTSPHSLPIGATNHIGINTQQGCDRC